MKYLIVKTSAIGDIIQSLHVASYIKSVDKSADIHWIVDINNQEIVSSCIFIDKVIAIDFKKIKKLNIKYFFKSIKTLRQERYDILFDLQGNFKSSLIDFFAIAKDKVGFGIKSVSEKINLFFTNSKFDVDKKINIKKQYLMLLKKYFKDEKDNYLEVINEEIPFKKSPSIKRDFVEIDKGSFNVLICPFSKWKNKELDFHLLIRYLNFLSKEIKNIKYYFVFSNYRERKIAESLNNHFKQNSVLLDKMNLPSLFFLMKKMNLVISVDSALLHLAGLAKTPIISFFGPSSSAIYHPITAKSLVFSGNCYKEKNIFKMNKRCKNLRKCKYNFCINNFDEEKVFQQSIDWINKNLLSNSS